MTSREFFGDPLPPGAIIGLLGGEACGISRELERAADRGTYWPRDLYPDFAPADRFLLIDYALDVHDALIRIRAGHQLSAARRLGATILLATWDERLLLELCDEVWCVDLGRVVAKGDPSVILENWRAQLSAVWLRELTGTAVDIASSPRTGDGRASIQQVELLNAEDQAVLGWASGDSASVRITLRFNETLPNPVIGMLIRTRVGLDVYGTNTELERLEIGPRQPGEQIHVVFQFSCDLCPGEYTLTMASHDPDGTRHEWLEDAVAFSVSDIRYTAGIANLRAQVSWELVEKC